MNKFERVSETEYNKVLTSDCTAKNGVICVAPYENIKLPHRATVRSAGYDFFSPISFKLKPGQTIKVPTFVKAQLSHGRVLMLYPRSSYGFKYRMQLDNTVGVVDGDYYNNESNEGHIFIKITNDSKTGKTLEVNVGDAFAQGIIMGYEITDDDEVTDKRTGGIGSTSKPQKFDMSKKCGLEYFNKWNQMNKGQITYEEFINWFNMNCEKCKYMSEICMYGEE